MLKQLILAAAAVLLAGCGPDVPEEGALGEGGTGDAAGGEAQEVPEAMFEAGDYAIHYRAVLTRALAPEIREGYGFPESSDEVLLIVSVEQRESGDSVPAAVDAEAVNLSGQRVNIQTNEVHANDMISYIGLVEVEDREVLDFHVRILPQGASEPIDFQFQRRFFTEPPPAAAGIPEPVVAAAPRAAATATAASQPAARPLPDLGALDVDRRKVGFFEFLLPIVSAVNAEIRQEKSRLEAAAVRVEQGGRLWGPAQRWLRRLGRDYGVRVAPDETAGEALAKLLRRVDVVPAPLVLAQAAKESGWGTSRFAVQGNNLFGQRCYAEGCGLTPKALDRDAGFAVAQYDSVRESVASYVRNLNTHPLYDEFRDLRSGLRASGVPLESLLLAEGLAAYSEQGRRYVAEVKTLIRQNRAVLGRIVAGWSLRAGLSATMSGHDAVHHHRGHHGLRTAQAEQSGRADRRRGADRVGA